MDETRRNVLEAELSQALQDRERLNVVISYLRERLGLESPPVDVVVSPATVEAKATIPTPNVVAEGEFFGMSGPKAAVIVLERAGRSRPLKTDELFQAIKKGGVSVGSAGTLYRSLFRDDRFKRVGKGLWGLSKWYGGAATAKGQKGQPSEIAASEPEPESDALADPLSQPARSPESVEPLDEGVA